MAKDPIKRLSIEEAENLFEAKSTITPDGQAKWRDEVYGFTLTPSTDPQYPASEGWEDVTYYTARKKDAYKDMDYPGDGFVYVLINESMPGMVKIGYTSDRVGPEGRARALSAPTAIPTPYRDAFAFRCFNGEVLERMVHEELKSFRVNSKREHFYVTVEHAKQVIKQLGKGFTNGME